MKALRGIVIIIIAAVIAYLFIHFFAKRNPATEKPVPENPPITFYCAHDATIRASFATSSVAIALSDGRSFTLPQVVSGSGAKYEATTTGVSPADITFWNEGNNAFLTENDKTTYAECTAAFISPATAAGYDTYSDIGKTFSFTFPHDFSVTGVDTGYSLSWSALATTSGMVLAKITVPNSFEPKTNFGDATFTVGTSADPSALALCLANPARNRGTTTLVTINGIPFTKLQYGDVGAGNYYDTTSYRVVRDNQCYAVEYTIHYANFENYPAGAVQKFDETKIATALDAIVQSFSFTAPSTASE